MVRIVGRQQAETRMMVFSVTRRAADRDMELLVVNNSCLARDLPSHLGLSLYKPPPAPREGDMPADTSSPDTVGRVASSISAMPSATCPLARGFRSPSRS